MNARELTDRHGVYGAQVVLRVADVRKTLDWYRDVLGFHIDFEYGDPPTHARVATGDRSHSSAARIRFQLGESPGEVSPHCSIYLHVADGMLDELCEEFNARGVQITEPPSDRPWGRQFSIRDLNGYTLSFLPAG